jgi:hypothetical protein
MNDKLRRAAFNRKLRYGGIILALFTLSLFWRGKIGIPGGNFARAAEAERTKQPVRFMDRLASLPIGAQAEKLEMRELDLGDAEVAGSVARVSLVGFRGVVVTGMWWSAIEKQKRGEYHEFELLARTVTRLQPHFITPWIFQAWNIAYNVSVENDKLGDMYFYIARGIELLAEGDRLNSRKYRGLGFAEVDIGSPDIRYQLGFYYQNKFTVSDKVATLRSLMQLSAMKPSERDPANFLDAQDRVIPAKFQKFCEDNPQLVRRLADKLACKTPRDVIDFLRVNKKVPTRYKDDGSPDQDDLVSAELQFPILPKAFGLNEYNPLKPTDDAFDAIHAARAWYEYAQMVIPPPLEGFAQSSPKAAKAGQEPQDGEYDPFRYRMPVAPSLIIFRMQPGRSQSYLAERLQKEGWFDAATRWNPADNGLGNWFATPASAPRVQLEAKRNSQAEYATAFEMWDSFGKRNGLNPTPEEEKREQEAAKRTEVLGPFNQFPNFVPPNQAAFDRLGISRADYRARLSLSARRTNKSITNSDFFLFQSRAEMTDALVAARKQLAAAEREKENGSFTSAARLYAKGLAMWRQALLPFRDYRDIRDTINEQSADYLLALTALLKDDAAVRKQLRDAKDSLKALVGAWESPTLDTDWKNALAENEALSRIAMEMPNPDLDQAVNAKVPNGDEASKRAERRALIDTEFAWLKWSSEKRRGSPTWVPQSMVESQKKKLGMLREPPPPPSPAGG